jgi:hypothetical protein
MTTTKEAFEVIISALNSMNYEHEVTDTLNEVLVKLHPTLQQNFMKHLIIPAIENFAQKKHNGYYDLRNEASCVLASKLAPLTKEACLPFI